MSRRREPYSDQNTMINTPTNVSTPNCSSLYYLRERLERQMANSQGKPEKQTSPTLEKLKMTPGRVLKDRETLTNKHLHVRQKADKLNVGGGVCLWPGMDDMRLSCREVIELVLVSMFLLGAVIYAFYKLHGSTMDELFRYHGILVGFHDNHRISLTQSLLKGDLQTWHRAYRSLILQIHTSFDITRVPVMYVMYTLVYTGGMGFLVYCLVDNMLAKSKLSPNRIKQWVSILVVISTWTGALCYFLMAAYMVESAIERNFIKLTHSMGEALERDLDVSRLSDMITYWQETSHRGTLSVLGLVTVRDLVHYLQYYFIPIITIIVTPIVKLVMSLYSVYHVT